MQPIGRIRSAYAARGAVPGDPFSADDLTTIEIDPRFRSALRGIIPGSELFVLWWADHAHRDAVIRESGTTRGCLGVFASRVPDRPNPIMVSWVRVESVDEPGGTLSVVWCDAVDGSPVLDLKIVVHVNGEPR